MFSRYQLRATGIIALVTGALLLASLLLFQGGPTSGRPNAVLSWFTRHATEVRIGSVLWLLAMIGLVAFAIAFRESMWLTVVDRSWVTVLFVQGAAVFATVVVVAAALGWALADGTESGTFGAELAGAIWGIERMLLRFASWGLTVPLVVVGLALTRHSLLGKISAAAAVVVAVTLLVPFTWGPALYAFAAWLALAGTTLLMPHEVRSERTELVS